MERLRRVLDRIVADGAPAAIAQFRDDSGTRYSASGVAELGGTAPPPTDGWFRIGSVTKTFTATLTLQLVGAGRLGLDDPVERWLPGLVPGGEAITVRRLLDHTSGLYNYTDALPGAAGIVRDRLRRWGPAEMVAIATARGPAFPPGTGRAYNNTGYLLLGMVIEAVTGRGYGAEVEARILRPLGLARTRVPDGAVLPEPHSRGYLDVDGTLVDVTASDPSNAWSAGGMVSTLDDLNRFFAGLFTGALLGPAELDAMLSPAERATNIGPAGIGFAGIGPAEGTGPAGWSVDGGLGVFRVALPGGGEVWGKDGGFFGYHTWSFHTRDATRQLTISATAARNRRPPTAELLAGLAPLFRD